ncbi:unnamed protein product [Acanthosepion pharaonis]|uniref:Uncharacterized protein n=1 Tax=Acanthosepion pharaonis TaxID=158019 RepID=A0A812DAB4_ACAPH|nr:unnamed protein product [Sepia pharaonis]
MFFPVFICFFLKFSIYSFLSFKYIFKKCNFPFSLIKRSDYYFFSLTFFYLLFLFPLFFSFSTSFSFLFNNLSLLFLYLSVDHSRLFLLFICYIYFHSHLQYTFFLLFLSNLFSSSPFFSPPTFSFFFLTLLGPFLHLSPHRLCLPLNTFFTHQFNITHHHPLSSLLLFQFHHYAVEIAAVATAAAVLSILPTSPFFLSTAQIFYPFSTPFFSLTFSSFNPPPQRSCLAPPLLLSIQPPTLFSHPYTPSSRGWGQQWLLSLGNKSTALEFILIPMFSFLARPVYAIGLKCLSCDINKVS